MEKGLPPSDERVWSPTRESNDRSNEFEVGLLDSSARREWGNQAAFVGLWPSRAITPPIEAKPSTSPPDES